MVVQDGAHCVRSAVALLLILVFVVFFRHKAQMKGIWGPSCPLEPLFQYIYLGLPQKTAVAHFIWAPLIFQHN